MCRNSSPRGSVRRFWCPNAKRRRRPHILNSVPPHIPDFALVSRACLPCAVPPPHCSTVPFKPQHPEPPSIEILLLKNKTAARAKEKTSSHHRAPHPTHHIIAIHLQLHRAIPIGRDDLSKRPQESRVESGKAPFMVCVLSM